MEISKISKIRNNIISAPFTPMEAAKCLMKHFEISPGKLTALYSVTFPSSKILQQYDGPDGPTSFGFLVIEINSGQRFFYIDMGHQGLTVFIIDGDEVHMSPLLENKKFLEMPDMDLLIKKIRELPYE